MWSWGVFLSGVGWGGVLRERHVRWRGFICIGGGGQNVGFGGGKECLGLKPKFIYIYRK